MLFQKRLKALMAYKNLKVTDLAPKVGVTPNTLYRYLNNKTDIGSEKLLKLLSSMDIDVNKITRVRISDNSSKKTLNKEITRHILLIIDMLTPTERKILFKTVLQLANANERKSKSGKLADSIKFLETLI